MSDSDSDEENAIRYGTPLEPYEEDEIPSKRKYQQQPDQFAVDAHGRRRFHGAFTGGFSAGFGNTVGTPEGWTPATFKSSRGEKAKFSGQRPEDFMDEEDRSEYGIAPQQMVTQSEFSGRKRPMQQRYHDGPIPGEPVLEQLLRPVHETAAVRMLHAMGWRPGQGAGDRVTRAEKKRRHDQHKVYGCYMPEDMRQPTQASDSSDSEFEYDTLFAPDDYEPYVLQRKSDRFGLGYSGLSRHSVLGTMTGEYGQGSSRSHLVMKDKGKKVSIRGQAFGVGALEADDEDIYATEDMSHYDFSLGGAREAQVTKGKQEANVVEGFVRASQPLTPVPVYPAPALPRDYTPLAAGARRSRFEPSPAPTRDQGTNSQPVPVYPAPALPRDYTPLAAGARRSRFEPSPAPTRDQGTNSQPVPVYPAPALPRDYTPLAAGARRSRFEPSRVPTRDQGTNSQPVPSYPAPALPRDYTPLAAGARRSRFEPSRVPTRDQGTNSQPVPVYPAPALPRDYTPLAAGARRSRFEPSRVPTRDQGTNSQPVPVYPAPALPRDYTPLAAGARRSRFEPSRVPTRDQGTNSQPVPSYPAPALPRDYSPLAAGARRSRFEPSRVPTRDQGTNSQPVPSYPAPALPRDYTPLAAGARRSRFEPSRVPTRDQGTNSQPVPVYPAPALPRDYSPLAAGARRSRFEPSRVPTRDQGTNSQPVPVYPAPALPRDYTPLAAGARRSRFEPSRVPTRDQGTNSQPVPVYPAPALPRDYTPLAAGARRSRFEPSRVPTRDQGLGRHDLSAEARGNLLGEIPVPKASVPTEQPDPVAQILGRNVNFVATDKIIDETTTKTKESEDFISIKDTGKEITKIFKPFVGDPAKQARYEKYLKDKSSVLEREDTIDRLSAWERNREISEFEQAAKLYKPLSGIMGDRFTHASEPDDALNPLTAVAKSSINRGQATPQQIAAATAGAYGAMTRSEAPWRPESLVCKRFNVPELGARQESRKEDKPKVSYSIFNYLENSVHDKDSFAREQSKFSGSKSLSRETISVSKSNDKTNDNDSNLRNDKNNDDPEPSTSMDTGINKRLTVAELFLKESEKDLKNKENVEVTETINKFDKMDLYKSIFLSDSENEDNAQKDDTSQNDNPSINNDFTDVPKNVERNLSPPRGIFANIDFDEINSWKRNAEKKAEEKTESDKNEITVDKSAGNANQVDKEVDAYGPKIPENLKKRLEEQPERDKMEKPLYRSRSEREVLDVSSSSSDSWVEAKQVKPKKKKKKSKKHKKQKKSKKHKKKDR